MYKFKDYKCRENDFKIVQLEKHYDEVSAGTDLGFIGKFLRTNRALCEAVSRELHLVEPSVFNGYRKFCISKYTELVKFLCDKHGVSRTKLNKLMFYTDFYCFQLLGNSLTGSSYIHHYHGPVCSDQGVLWGCLLQSGQLESREVPCEYVPEPVELICASEDANLRYFSDNELRVIELVKGQFSQMNARDIREYSHNEEAYFKTEQRDLISYEYARTLKHKFHP